MFRVITLAVACLIIHHVSADTNPRDLDFESRLSNLEELGTLIYTVKNQFKAVIEEILLHFFEYIKALCHQLKVKILKKLAKWTLSDMFHSVFDGVTDFVIESSPSAGVFTSSPASHPPPAPPTPVRPNNYYFRPNPYGY